MSTLGATSFDLRLDGAPNVKSLEHAAARWYHFRWLTRPRRVLLTLAAVWVINVFDLGYTLLESLTATFIEMNPVAARLIAASPLVLVAYKVALILISSTILLIHRRKRLTELACWLLLAVYIGVAGCWRTYYDHRLASLDDPAVNVEPLIGRIIN